VTVELFADHGELGEREWITRCWSPGSWLKADEHREEDQQQRKDREHAVVGEESGEVRAAVLDVLLDDADRKGGVEYSLVASKRR